MTVRLFSERCQDYRIVIIHIFALRRSQFYYLSIHKDNLFHYDYDQFTQANFLKERFNLRRLTALLTIAYSYFIRYKLYYVLLKIIIFVIQIYNWLFANKLFNQSIHRDTPSYLFRHFFFLEFEFIFSRSFGKKDSNWLDSGDTVLWFVDFVSSRYFQSQDRGVFDDLLVWSRMSTSVDVPC